jgi:hypothetical protein
VCNLSFSWWSGSQCTGCVTSHLAGGQGPVYRVCNLSYSSDWKGSCRGMLSKCKHLFTSQVLRVRSVPSLLMLSVCTLWTLMGNQVQLDPMDTPGSTMSEPQSYGECARMCVSVFWHVLHHNTQQVVISTIAGGQWPSVQGVEPGAPTTPIQILFQVFQLFFNTFEK